jgi:hypothetical protein
MVSHCANPSCGRAFHYLRGGRLYSFELRSTKARSANEDPVRKRVSVYFWICEQCCDTLSLEFDQEHGVVLKESWEEGASQKLSCETCAEANTAH